MKTKIIWKGLLKAYIQNRAYGEVQCTPAYLHSTVNERKYSFLVNYEKILARDEKQIFLFFRVPPKRSAFVRTLENNEKDDDGDSDDEASPLS